MRCERTANLMEVPHECAPAYAPAETANALDTCGCAIASVGIACVIHTAADRTTTLPARTNQAKLVLRHSRIPLGRPSPPLLTPFVATGFWTLWARQFQRPDPPGTPCRWEHARLLVRIADFPVSQVKQILPVPGVPQYHPTGYTAQLTVGQTSAVIAVHAGKTRDSGVDNVLAATFGPNGLLPCWS